MSEYTFNNIVFIVFCNTVGFAAGITTHNSTVGALVGIAAFTGTLTFRRLLDSIIEDTMSEMQKKAKKTDP